jgi:hypothetical protein
MNTMGKPQKIMDRSASPACPMTMSNTYHLIDTILTTAKIAAPTEAVTPISHRTRRSYAPQLRWPPICADMGGSGEAQR